MVIIAAGFLFSCLLPSSVAAVEVTPSSFDLSFAPGEAGSAPVTIINSSDAANSYSMSLAKVTFGRDADELSFAPIAKEYTSWFSVDAPEFVLEPGEKKDVNITVHVPKDAVSEAFTVALLAEEKSNDGTGTNVRTSAASLVFLHIGNVSGNVAVQDFRVNADSFFSKEVDITALYENIGSDTVVAPAEVVVRNMFGQEVGHFYLSPTPKRVPPGSVRSLVMTWPEEGRGPKYFFGTYTFSLLANENPVASAKVTLLSLPIFIALFIGFDLLVLGILRSVRNRNRVV